MKKLLVPVFGFLACAPVPELVPSSLAKILHVIAPSELLLAPDALISIDVSSTGETLKELHGQIFLLMMPEAEEITRTQWEKSETFTLSILEKRQRISLRPKKKLKEGCTYGIYFRSKTQQKAHVSYVFRVKRKAAELVRHDLGSGIKHFVPANRIHYSFVFDEPVHLPNDHAIKLTSTAGEVPIQSITVAFSKKEIRVTLAKDKLRAGEQYSFIFAELLNEDDQKAPLSPLSFTVREREAALGELEALKMAVGHDAAEIRWLLDRDHQGEIFFGEDKSVHQCLEGPCPQSSQVFVGQSEDETPSFLSSFFLAKLKAKTAYHFVVRAEDMQGNILLNAGTFKTEPGPSLRFSEILVAPKMPPGIQENRAEFIELYNGAQEAQTYNALKLMFEGLDGQHRRECIIASHQGPLTLKAQTYALIVGQEFDSTQFNIPSTTTIIRLPKKSLCGGLVNDRPTILKIIGDKGRLLDRYGAFRWGQTEGMSIARKESLGADEEQNYCLSAEETGPSPGLKNDKLGSCG